MIKRLDAIKQNLSTKERRQGHEILVFCIITILMLYVLAFTLSSPRELLEGMGKIIISRDTLITDYTALVGYGAAFLNCAIMMTIVLGVILHLGLAFNGLTVAAIFINAGFALFGKNPVNILPILLGSYVYAKMQGVKINRYIYTALFGTSLSPLVTEMVYLLPFHWVVNILFAILLGIIIGFVLPPLAVHTVSMHNGYNLFNVGFAAGLLALGIVSILRAIGLESEAVLVWREGRPIWFVVGLYGYFALAFLYGLIINQGKIKPLFKLFRHPGRAVADFILMDGIGTTFMNMGVVGAVCVTYIIAIGGDLSGPVVGGILTVFGFSAFGVHVKNYVPVLFGVFLATGFIKYDATNPSLQLAAMFCAGVSPIAGQFGVIAGITAGIIQACIVLCTGEMYAGLNLYNNGFAAGLVAILMLPVLEAFIKRFKDK